jgi:hypothetical protein
MAARVGATAPCGPANPREPTAAARPAAAFDADAGPVDEALPTVSTEELRRRAQHLIEAIAQDSPALAGDLIFPREGFVSARDTRDPTKAWERSVSNPFERRIATLHKRFHGLEQAQVVSVELGHAAAQMTPRTHEWKKPLWRVKHSRVLVSVGGKVQRLELPELTAWRGAWYVTRL